MQPLPIEITDEDIIKVEEHFSIKFNLKQIEFIKFLQSCDLQACPGSGKTTTLAAKLYILSYKMPATFNGGVCIMTHTNVAVDEIRAKLGEAAGRFLRYPNHLGTIQSFIDKFLTVPGYNQEFGYRPYGIDNDSYYKALEIKFNSTREFRNSLLGLEHRRLSHFDLRFSTDDFTLVSSIYNTRINMASTTPTMVNALACKKAVLKDGYIGFEDAYSVAFQYLRKYPQLKDLFSRRFQYVFIDEMQDMDSFQVKILGEIFPRNQNHSILQRIGDINQAIYHSTSSSGGEAHWNPENHMELSESLRMSKIIAEKVANVSIKPQQLGGVENCEQIAPVIFAFDESSLLQVKERFAELIIQHGLHIEQRAPFKAIGLKKDHGKATDSAGNLKLSIKDYFEDFGKLSTVLKKDHNYYYEYFETAIIKPSQIIDSILLAYCKALQLAKIKHNITGRYFTPSSLKRFLKETFPNTYLCLYLWMESWFRNFIAGIDIIESSKSYLVKHILSIWNADISNQLGLYLTAETSEIIPDSNNNTPPIRPTTIYKYMFESGEINIEFNTIHAVKGETHSATLFLETYNRTFDVEKILPFAISTRTASKRQQAALKLKPSYVAITRPKHLLCIAVRKTIVIGIEQQLRNAGWDIVLL